MFNSLVSLRAAQTARTLSLPDQVDAPSPAREALLESFRQRNALLDYLFYDVGVVTPDEARAIAPRWAAEGAILLVPPSGQGALKLCLSVDAFVEAGGADVHALAVAGVGSSALGSAAFARNVADAIGRPVAAVVSGYGLADLVTEALGGFFWFGTLNSIRHQFEELDRLTQPTIVEPPEALIEEKGFLLARLSRDTETLVALLADKRLSFDLLTGHSKGNLVVSEALFEMRRLDPERTAEFGKKVVICTVSALIAMPRQFGTVIDILGAWDWFGAFNSRGDIPVDRVVPRAWHHTNTDLPASLHVTANLKGALGN